MVKRKAPVRKKTVRKVPKPRKRTVKKKQPVVQQPLQTSATICNPEKTDPVRQYAHDVLEGREIAGPLVRLACKRHLDDLAQGEKRGLRFDLDRAMHTINFFPRVLRLNFETAFHLHPSQAFIVGSVFGWLGSDGYRRFRTAYVEEGKGNGKSPLAGGIALYMLRNDNEYRPEIYFAAENKDQARIPFRDAISMWKLAPDDWRESMQASGGDGNEWQLAYHAVGGFMKPIATESTGKGKSGPRVHCGILDEVHEHSTPTMAMRIRQGTKGRNQALILYITNSGVVDNTAICYELHMHATEVLEGRMQDDAGFFYVCGLDKGDNWQDPRVWKKSNPLLGVSVTEKYIGELVHEAVGMPSKQSDVRRFNCCEWVGSISPLVEPDVWEANSAQPRTDLDGRACVAAFDLSRKNDLTSGTLLFDEDEDGKKDVIQHFWTPADTVKMRSEKDRAPYQQWIDEGLITATPGKTIDYEYVADRIDEWFSKYDLRVVAVDPWNFDHLEAEINKRQTPIKVVKHAQGFGEFTGAIQALEDNLKETKLRHGGNKVLTWCINNVRVESNASKARMFNKEKSTGRIDGATTLAMASNIQKTFPAPDAEIIVTILG